MFASVSKSERFLGSGCNGFFGFIRSSLVPTFGLLFMKGCTLVVYSVIEGSFVTVLLR